MQKILLVIALLFQFSLNSFAAEPVTDSNSTDSTDSSEMPDFTSTPRAFEKRNSDQYFDWSFFIDKQGSKNVCYIAALTIRKAGDYQERGEPYFIVTKTAGKLPEISVSSGYYYKENSEAELSFGLEKFYLFTYKSYGWTYSIDDDIEIIKALRDSDSVIVSSTSTLNKSSEDSYSLIGFNKAYQRLQKECK